MRVQRGACCGPIFLLLIICVLGCGKKGPPRPPQPRGPFPPEQVRSRQLGSRGIVNFTVPDARGTKPSQQPVRAELLRVTYPPGPEPAPDPAAFRRRGVLAQEREGQPLISGQRLEMIDEALGDLPDSGRDWTVRYAIRVRDRRGRSSPLVLAPDLIPAELVEPPSELTAEPTADGMRLTWRSPDQTWTYNVYRAASDGPVPEFPLNPEPVQGNEYLDDEVETGSRYRYVVRGVLADGAVFRESEAGSPREVLAEDRFAPSDPEGLVAVQEGPAVRLFWDPNSERDLGGYRVYRRVDAGPWIRLEPDRVEQPLYLDLEVEAGTRYAYRVTAVDRILPPNESLPSEEFAIEIVDEPGVEAP